MVSNTKQKAYTALKLMEELKKLLTLLLVHFYVFWSTLIRPWGPDYCRLSAELWQGTENNQYTLTILK